MIMNSKPYPISFEREMSQALVCRYGEEMRQYVFKPDIDVSGLSCLLSPYGSGLRRVYAGNHNPAAGNRC